MRLRNKPWAQDMLREHPQIIVPHPTKLKGNWNARAKQREIHVEVGTGKGKFLNEMSGIHPNIYFIGIEKYASVLVHALQKALAGNANNLSFIHGNVSEMIDFFAENEIDCLYMNFTDPWPKKRHEKRRLTYKEFLRIYEHVLKPNGKILLKTDNQHYFEYSIESLSTYGMVIENVSLDLHQSGWEGNVTTEYEEKFSKKGQPIYRLEARFR